MRVLHIRKYSYTVRFMHVLYVSSVLEIGLTATLDVHHVVEFYETGLPYEINLRHDFREENGKST